MGLAIPKPQREIDLSYTAFVKSQPCCLPIDHVCGLPITPHHVSKRDGTKGMGSKVSDRRQVPLCLMAHRLAEIHPQEYKEYFEVKIHGLNREYGQDRVHEARLKREIHSPVLKSITVHCPCGLLHDIPAGKVSRFGAGLRYRCFRRNTIESVSIA